jgi:SOUL heme-binding protein
MRPMLLTLAVAASVLTTPAAHAIEEPKFELLQQSGSFELRRYAPYVVAEVRVPGNFSEAGNQGFRLLANYIFGGNQGQRKLAMTAPVIQAAAEPVKLAMTAPVIQSAAPQGGHIVQFVLPADITLATAPVPNNPQVQLREEPARTLAVMRYSGSWSQRNYDEQLAALRSAADQAGIKLKGEPVLSRFNGPFTLPFLRRNEIWFAVQE